MESVCLWCLCVLVVSVCALCVVFVTLCVLSLRARGARSLAYLHFVVICVIVVGWLGSFFQPVQSVSFYVSVYLPLRKMSGVGLDRPPVGDCPQLRLLFQPCSRGR